MEQMFPYGTDISEVRGVVRIIKDSNKSHVMPLSELSQQSNYDINDLLPALEASRMLGFTSLDNGKIRLTKSGERLHLNNFRSVIGSYLLKIEPFKAAKECIIKYGNLNTREMAERLRKRSVVFRANEKENDEILRYLLLRWAVKCGIFGYDVHEDRWRLS